jgi:ornithine decarboxylase
VPGSFDSFATTLAAPHQASVRIKERQGAMTPKIARFLSDVAPATPCLVLDLERVAENYAAIKAAIPGAHIYYAVKANPARPVLGLLTGLGSCFDAAGIEEIRECLEAGARPEAISFGNTVKKAAAIAEAHARGVSLFAFDAIEELDKIARHAPGAKVYCRIEVANAGADWPLSKKFGTTAERATALLLRARELGLDPYGVSFHVGSQQTGTAAHEAAIARAAMVFTDLKARGIELRMLNLGGGFPVRYRDDVPGVDAFGDAIMRAMTTHFGNDLPLMLVEPGRAIVGDAGTVAAEVVLVSRRNPDADPRRWVYLDIGRFGGLAETEGEAIRYTIAADPLCERRGPAGPVVLAGPSCDGVDVMYEQTPYHLPLDLQSGDRVLIEKTGAYVTSYASQNFNGFRPLAEHYI